MLVRIYGPWTAWWRCSWSAAPDMIQPSNGGRLHSRWRAELVLLVPQPKVNVSTLPMIAIFSRYRRFTSCRNFPAGIFQHKLAIFAVILVSCKCMCSCTPAWHHTEHYVIFNDISEKGYIIYSVHVLHCFLQFCPSNSQWKCRDHLSVCYSLVGSGLHVDYRNPTNNKPPPLFCPFISMQNGGTFAGFYGTCSLEHTPCTHCMTFPVCHYSL